jgi:hypothetical protein
VPYYNSTHHVAKHLDHFLKLQSLDMFVVAGVRKPLQQAHWKRLQDWVRTKRKRDIRVFFVEIPAMDIQVEWEEEMRGGESIWDRAFRYTIQWEAREKAEELVRISACSPMLISIDFITRNYRGQTAEVSCRDGPVEMQADSN